MSEEATAYLVIILFGAVIGLVSLVVAVFIDRNRWHK